MCRIAVLVSDHRSDLDARIGILTDAMARGGPDDAGTFIDPLHPVAFGHRRLSIIDTSAAGHQPMHFGEKYTITYNGEIYNYAELRAELITLGYTFQTATDTEVLLAGYDAWGQELPRRLRGMFAFVILNRATGILFAVRDHAGIKPLYFAKQGGDYFFTSEVRALLKLDPDWEPDLDWPVLFLTFGFIPEPFTTLKNVRPLKKGHWMQFDIAGRTWKEEAWYHTSYNTLDGISAEQAVAETRRLMEQSVRRHLVADVPVGVFLSGGLDSSALAVLCAATTGELPSDNSELHRHKKLLLSDISELHSDKKLLLSDIPELHRHKKELHSDISELHSHKSLMHPDISELHSHKKLLHSDIQELHRQNKLLLADQNLFHSHLSVNAEAQLNILSGPVADPDSSDTVSASQNESEQQSSAKSHAALKTLSIDFEDTEWSEQEYQNLVAAQIGSEHHRFVVTKNDFIESWPEIFESLDQPTTDAINSHFICRYARQLGLKVVVSGLGGDEVFGGYPSFDRARHFRRWQRLGVLMQGVPGFILPYALRKLKFLPEKFDSAEYLLYRGLFTPQDVSKILGMRIDTVRNIIKRVTPLDNNYGNLPPATRAGALEAEVYMLNQLLKDADVQSMWHGIELRVPFLDADLMQYVQALPDAIKFPENGKKYLLRAAVTGLVAPQILNRKKQGFVFPFDRWFSELKVFDDKHFITPDLLRDFRKKRINYSRMWAVLLAKTRGRNLNLMRADTLTSAPRIAFIYLAAFDITGGIEKVNKVLMHCLDPDVRPGKVQASAISLHDEHIDSRYFPAWLFKGFGGRRIAFLWYLFRHARRFDAVLVGHLNLSPAVLLMRLIQPKLKIILMVHGIEAWRPQGLMQRFLLKHVSRIISVSKFTASVLTTVSDVNPAKITVIPNCLDPFFRMRVRPGKPRYLLNRYGIEPDEKILLTITRLNRFEKYKGYDFVIETLPQLKRNRNLRYIIAGKGDEYELDRLRLLAEDSGVADMLHLPGFIENDELQDHYRLADVFVMPSRKEGFGLVLIEAAATGIPVIAGNSDGSVEAMQYGTLGRLVNPEDSNEILMAIEAALNEQRELNQQRSIDLYDSKKYVQAFNRLLLAEVC